MEVLGDFLADCIGHESKQTGMCAFHVRGIFRAANGELFYEE